MTAEQKKQAKEFKDEKNALAYVVQYNSKNTKNNFAIARNFGGRFFVELVNEAAIPANSERVYVK